MIGAKQHIDIQGLLDWAFRVQCVDKMCRISRPSGPSASPASSFAAFMELGTLVDNSGFAAKMIGSRNVADDAVAVYNAALALPDYHAEFLTNTKTRIWAQGSIDEKCSIKRESSEEASLLRPDKKPLRHQKIVSSALVIQHAKSGTAPDWLPDWKPRRGAPRRGGIDLRGRRGKSSDGWRVEDVSVIRAEYSVWVLSMGLLAETLQDELSGYHVQPFSMPLAPWQGESGNHESVCVQ